MGYRVVGADLSERMIALAKASALAGCVFYVADACSLPFADASFDVTTVMSALEFIACVETEVGEMARCTKAGGRILVGTINRFSTLTRKRLARGQEPYVSGRLLSPHELWALLAPIGTVRMLASSPRDAAAGGGNIVRRLEARSGMLSGPLLLAEVRKRA